MATKQDLPLIEGKTFNVRVLWISEDTYIHVPIASMSATGPLVVATLTPHGMPDEWPVAVVGAKGLTELNTTSIPPAKKDFRMARKVDASSVEFNQLNGSLYGAHTASTGYLQFYAPMPVAGTEPYFVVREGVDGAVLLEAGWKEGVSDGRITINTTGNFYDITVPASALEALAWKKGVYEMETLDTGSGVCYPVASGKIVVTPELAT